MAIFDKLECNVMIDGQPLPEYEVPSDEDTSGAIGKVNGPKIEKYIESRAGENFIVRVHLPKKYKFKRCDALKCTIYVDGKKIEVAVMLDDDMEEDGTNTMNHPGSNEFVNGEWILRKFRFSSLNIADESNEAGRGVSMRKLRSLGHIKVQIHRAKMTDTNGLSNSSALNERVSMPKLSEKCLKGRSVDSFVSLDAPIKEEEGFSQCTTKLVGKVPLVTIIFHYRSREILQKLGIVEKPLNQRPLEDKDPATLTHEEVLELLRRKEDMLRQQEETEKLMKKRLRQEQARNNLRTLDAIKRARSPSPQDNGSQISDEEVQVVKRAKKDRKIEVVELD